MLHSLISNTFDATTLASIGFAGFVILNMFIRYTQTHKFGDRSNPCVPTVSGATELATIDELDLSIPEDVLDEVIEETVTQPIDTQTVALEPVVEVAPTPTVTVEEVAERPTRRELLAIAKAHKVKGYSRMSTDDLYQAVLQIQ